MKKLSFTVVRIITGFFLAIALLCTANYLLELKVFGRFAKDIMVICYVILALFLMLFGPTVRELYEYRDKKRAESKKPSDQSGTDQSL
jgi:hypothetical protein